MNHFDFYDFDIQKTAGTCQGLPHSAPLHSSSAAAHLALAYTPEERRMPLKVVEGQQASGGERLAL